MEKYAGSIEELRVFVENRGLKGEWREQDGFHQFREAEGGIINWWPSTKRVAYQGPPAEKSRLEAVLSDKAAANTSEAGTGEQPIYKQYTKDNRNKVFVVHGHDQTAREQLELVLHKLRVDPFVLANTGGGGLTIIEALEKEINASSTGCRFGIVLLTPDDMGYRKDQTPTDAQARARQNVVLEMGMLISSIGRGKVAILKKGHVEVPSDAQGILYIPFNDHVKETVPKLVDRLRQAGFNLEPAAITAASA